MSVSFSVGLDGVSTPDQLRVPADRLFERDEIGQINEIDGQLPTSKDATQEAQDAVMASSSAIS